MGKEPAAVLRQLAAAVIVALGLCSGAGAQQPEAQPTPQDPAAGVAEQDLERLQEQISGLEARLAALGERRQSVVAEWEAADVRLAVSRRQLQLARIRLDALTEELGERRREVDRLEVALAAGRQELAQRVVALHRMGPLSYARFLLAADTAEEVLAGYQLVSRLAAQDRSLVARVRRRLGEHREAVAQLAATRERLEGVRRDEAETAARLAREQEDREALIRWLDVESSSERQLLQESLEDAAELESLLDELTRPAAAAAPAPAAGEAAGAGVTGFAAREGELPWPGQGPVTLGFGRQRHPVYDTYTVSKGIEIEAEAGSPIVAVDRGRVVFTDWLQGYGLVVILDHGAEFYTIYGHMAAVDVRVGDEVVVGDALGTVGDTGSLTGPSLYFEIREGREALNPRRWLRPR